MDFLVSRSNLSEFKFVNMSAPAELGPGEVLIRVAKFAFTANNVTYAVAGDMLSYWNFFPAEEGWGRIPVWGIGVVSQSKHDGVAKGERFYGYYPMSTRLLVQPGKVSASGFVDVTEHRQSLPPTYNQYSLMKPEFGFDEKYDDFTMLLRPLFTTSFLLDDFFADNDFFGAGRLVLSSASSKTAFGLAHLLAKRADCEVVGLTSSGNKAFVDGLRCYDRVVTYDEIDALPNDGATAFVDMAGNGEVKSAVHHHYGDALKYSCGVGITHWKKSAPVDGLPGAKPAMFFAPDQVRKRAKDWGAAGFQERVGEAWNEFMEPVGAWITVVSDEGKEAVERVYRETLSGEARPDKGYVLSL